MHDEPVGIGRFQKEPDKREHSIIKLLLTISGKVGLHDARSNALHLVRHSASKQGIVSTMVCSTCSRKQIAKQTAAGCPT